MTVQIVLPNVRKILIPDPAHVILEGDLAGADAQVVAWEAEDEDLKDAFRKGLDVHVKNAEDMWGQEFTRLSGHARRAKRQETKKGVHLTNYGGSERTLAISLGWLQHEASKFQKRWFGIHPKIKTNFHGKVQKWLEESRTVWNPFGFRRVYFDRIDDCFTEALAWIPQSTVALNTFLGCFQLEGRYWPDHLRPGYYPDPAKPAGVLLQTHDSLTFQFPVAGEPPATELKKTLLVKTPYPDPLYIPWDLKRSLKSWGECEKI